MKKPVHLAAALMLVSGLFISAQPGRQKNRNTRNQAETRKGNMFRL
ncbi:hypothetical protein M5V91_13890 [Cytobacillus pseudoceanisediminis]|nr:hypothetical protein [Cytobacillus pseudoceanisediminis]UQX56548.1 hypothetical protein M5V91_13890 [Cytobacillus pseudoceanisediminis]